MKLTMLGTGHAMVTECYNTCFALEDEGQYFIVDGGGGSQILRQLKRAGIEKEKIQAIFVTHKHLDHLTGALWLLRMILQTFREEALTEISSPGTVRLYAHKELVELIRELCEKLLQPNELAYLDKRLLLIAVADGDQALILGHQVTFFDIASTKTKQFGFTMEIGNGEKLTCCGDEPYKPCEEKYVRESKWLLHEAFCLYSEADIFKPYEKHHSTVKDACELAQQLKIQNLILYHTEDRHIDERKKLYSEEGLRFYTGNLWIPDDLETIEV